MKSDDSLSNLLKRWEPKSPHTTAKFVNDTLRAIRLREQRPAWRMVRDGFLERLDGWIIEWMPAPRVLMPVAAALILMVAGLQWMQVDREAPTISALRWQQNLAQPMGQGSLANSYVHFIKE